MDERGQVHHLFEVGASGGGGPRGGDRKIAIVAMGRGEEAGAEELVPCGAAEGLACGEFGGRVEGKVGAGEVVEAGAEGWEGVKVSSGEGEVVDEIGAGGGSGAGEGCVVCDAHECGRMAHSDVGMVKDSRGSNDTEMIHVGCCRGSKDKEARRG